MLRDGLIGGGAVALATLAISPLLIWLLRLDGWGSLALAAAAFWLIKPARTLSSAACVPEVSL